MHHANFPSPCSRFIGAACGVGSGSSGPANPFPWQTGPLSPAVCPSPKRPAALTGGRLFSPESFLILRANSTA